MNPLQAISIICVPLAAMVSWDENGSILWALLHGSLSWVYLIYRSGLIMAGVI